MARSGINKKVLARHGGEALCFMSDEDVAARAKETGSTRAAACMEKAAELDKKADYCGWKCADGTGPPL
mgnify:CR=1 FL=1